MAYRLFNSSTSLLRIDLRGAETLQLAPGATSAPLREELLYDNLFVDRWEKEGLLTRLPARFEEVVNHEEHLATARKTVTKKPKAKKSAPEKKKHK